MNEAIKRNFCLSDFQSSLEPIGLSCDDGKRPDGITLSPWKNGLCLIWDFTCVNRLAMSNVARGTFPGPTIADKAVEAKRMKYESLTRNYIFQPVAVKHLGDLGTDTDDFLKQLCRQIIAETNDKRAGTFLR